MIPIVDIPLVVTLLLIFTKAGNLILRPHQRKAFDDFFDGVTLRLDDVRPFTWFRGLPHRKKWHWYLAAGLVLPFILSFVVMAGVNDTATSSEELTTQDKALAALGAWILTVVILNLFIVVVRVVNPRTLLILLLALAVTARHWYFGVMSSYSMSFASLVRYVTHGNVYCYPNLFANGKPPFWIWEPGVLESIRPWHSLGYSILGELAFVMVILVQVFSALLIATVGVAIFTGFVRVSRSLAWRVAEFDSGAFMGIMALIGLLLGGVRVLLMTRT